MREFHPSTATRSIAACFRQPPAWLAALLLALTFGLAPVAAGASDLLTYTIVAKNGRFMPNVLNVPAGTRFKIIVRNESDGAIEFESLQLRKEKVLGPGAASFVVIAPLKPGTYDFFDDFHPGTGHGQIIVK